MVGSGIVVDGVGAFTLVVSALALVLLGWLFVKLFHGDKEG